MVKGRVGKFFLKYKAECVELGVSWVCQANVHSHITVQTVGFLQANHDS